MARTSRSGNGPDERHWNPEDWFIEDADAVETDVPPAAAKGRSPGDWKASFQDLELTWNDATGAHEEHIAPPPDQWLQSLSDELETRADTERSGPTATAASPDSDAWWRIADEGGESDVQDVQDVPPRPPETEEWIGEEAGDSPPVTPRAATPYTAPVHRRPRTHRRSRRWLVVTAAVAVLLVGGATAVVALAGRGGGGKPAPSAAQAHRSNSSTTAATTTTSAAPAITAGPPPGPKSFTVQSTCRGRQCSLAVHNGPQKNAQGVGQVQNGQVVQIDCSTHGDLVKDTDTGQQSDVWYRYAGANTYSSSLYLQGPPVPNC